MSKKILIVESKNDEAVFKALIKHLSQEDNIDVDNADIENIDYENRSANEEETAEGLKDTLKSIFKDVAKGNYDKIGIVWDLDEFYGDKKYPQTTNKIDYRINQMNNAIKNVVSELNSYDISFEKPIAAINQFESLKVNGINIKIGCYFVHYQGKGELENLLKVIKSKPSVIADCIVVSLPDCLSAKESEKTATEKDLVKIWKEFYVRYDTLPDENFPKPTKQRTEAYTKWENIMQKRPYIFDFNKDDVVELKELKAFLIELVK